MRRSQRGFTLVELMISLVIFSFVVVGLLSVAVSMTGAFREQRDAVTAEGGVRVPIDYLADVLRQASPGVPGFNIADADTCSTSALTICNGSTLPGCVSTSTASDSLDVIFASGGVVTATATALTTNSVDLVDATGIAINDYVVISNISQGHFFKVSNKVGSTLTLGEGCSSFALPSGGYPAGSLVVRAQHALFTIGAISGSDLTIALQMDPDSVLLGGGSRTGLEAQAEPLAENIEDMQVAVGIDTAADGLSEASPGNAADEWIYNASGDSAVASWPPATGTIRAVRVTLIAKSPNQDVGNASLAYKRPAAEDRAIAATGDNFRRRVLRTTVEFRNVGVSP